MHISILSSGTISIYGTYARVLLDSGATHSFISVLFGLRLVRLPSALPYDLSISTPMGDAVRVNSYYVGCELSLGGKTLLVDLVPLPMVDFDIILGLDFLTGYHAVIDCLKKNVTFRFPYGEGVKFYEEKKVGKCRLIPCL